MKHLLTLLLITCSSLLYGDIPRVDILEVSFKGDTYYHYITMEGPVFKEGCVFSNTGAYLYEQEDFYKTKPSYATLHLYSDMITIPKANLISKNIDDRYNSKDFHHLTGKHIKLPMDSTDSVEIVKFILGNTGGHIFTPSLSKADESWIHDYKLEPITTAGDYELCEMELFSIKGNISQKEAKNIRAELNSIYKERSTSSDYNGKSPEEYLDELLKRNILMIGFCSC